MCVGGGDGSGWAAARVGDGAKSWGLTCFLSSTMYGGEAAMTSWVDVLGRQRASFFWALGAFGGDWY